MNMLPTLWDNKDDDAWDYGLPYKIIDHRKNEDAIPKLQGLTKKPTGAQKQIITTKRWNIKDKWETGETLYILLET